MGEQGEKAIVCVLPYAPTCIVRGRGRIMENTKQERWATCVTTVKVVGAKHKAQCNAGNDGMRAALAFRQEGAHRHSEFWHSLGKRLAPCSGHPAITRGSDA